MYKRDSLRDRDASTKHRFGMCIEVFYMLFKYIDQSFGARARGLPNMALGVGNNEGG